MNIESKRRNTGDGSRVFRAWVAALLGGAWGGVIVGLAEALSITLTAGPGEDYWLFPYGVVSYGLFGLMAGAGVAVLVTLPPLRRWRARAFGVSAALAFFLLGGAVLRYNLNLRVFHEELVTFSAVGLAVHVALALVVGGLALLLALLGVRVQRRRGGLLLATAGMAGCLLVTSAGALLAARAMAPAPVVRHTNGAAAGHPNVLLIIIDTLRADAIGAYSGDAQVTPHLDEFARDGVRFADTYSQATWTRPSIATILTSLYPSVHGAVHKFDALPDRVTTLAEAFRDGGYWTSGFVSNINVAPVFNFQQGFDEYDYVAPSFYFWATDSATRLAIYKGLRVLRERFFGNLIYFYNYAQDSAVVNRAVFHWLDQRPPNPFFLWVHYMDAHDPYFEIPYDGRGIARVSNPDPPASRAPEMHHLYGEDVHYLDEQLGRLFEHLKQLGLYEDTEIIVTADHGEEFQEHGGWWHGTTLYQEAMHVPLIIKRAREAQPGSVVSSVTRSLDIAPTAMAAAGMTPPSTFMGRNLFGPAPAQPPALYVEEDLEGNVLHGLREGPWKIIEANPGNPRGLPPIALYDLDSDPEELRNVAQAEPSRTARMLAALRRQQARIEERAALDGGATRLAARRP
jgi:arylsulfatase A-like enzyme